MHISDALVYITFCIGLFFLVEIMPGKKRKASEARLLQLPMKKINILPLIYIMLLNLVIDLRNLILNYIPFEYPSFFDPFYTCASDEYIRNRFKMSKVNCLKVMCMLNECNGLLSKRYGFWLFAEVCGIFGEQVLQIALQDILNHLTRKTKKAKLFVKRWLEVRPDHAKGSIFYQMIFDLKHFSGLYGENFDKPFKDETWAYIYNNLFVYINTDHFCITIDKSQINEANHEDLRFFGLIPILNDVNIMITANSNEIAVKSLPFFIEANGFLDLAGVPKEVEAVSVYLNDVCAVVPEIVVSLKRTPQSKLKNIFIMQEFKIQLANVFGDLNIFIFGKSTIKYLYKLLSNIIISKKLINMLPKRLLKFNKKTLPFAKTFQFQSVYCKQYINVNENDHIFSLNRWKCPIMMNNFLVLKYSNYYLFMTQENKSKLIVKQISRSVDCSIPMHY